MNVYSIPVVPAGMPPAKCIIRARDGAAVPFNQKNRDCIQFISDWKNGAMVTNADGSTVPYSNEAVAALGLLIE